MRFDVGVDNVVESLNVAEFSYLVDLLAELANCRPTKPVEIERGDYCVPGDFLYCPSVSLLLEWGRAVVWFERNEGTTTGKRTSFEYELLLSAQLPEGCELSFTPESVSTMWKNDGLLSSC